MAAVDPLSFSVPCPPPTPPTRNILFPSYSALTLYLIVALDQIVRTIRFVACPHKGTGLPVGKSIFNPGPPWPDADRTSTPHGGERCHIARKP